MSNQIKNKVNPIDVKVDANELSSSNEIDFEVIKTWVKGEKDCLNWRKYTWHR